MYYSLLILCAFCALVSAQSSPYPLGCYVWNPNGNDSNQMAQFEEHFMNFTNTMGVTPTHMNTFVDYSQNWTTWIQNAQWTAWSWSLSKYAKSVTPVVGIPMMPNSYFNDNEHALNLVIAGEYDSVFAGIASAFKAQGFTTIHARIGWEADGNWYAWNWNGKNSTGGSIVPQWVAAFRRISKAMKSVTGMTVLVNWNPSIATYSAFDIQDAYPGDDAVDIISLDIYSTLWPATLYDWEKDDGTIDANITVWLQSSVNREHAWDYPAANQWNKLSLGGWGMVLHLQFAQQHNKPVALSETGVGLSPSNPLNGLPNDTDFAPYVRSRFDKAGVKVAYVNVWDVNAGDGHWQFSDGTRPTVAAAWRANFGDGK